MKIKYFPLCLKITDKKLAKNIIETVKEEFWNDTENIYCIPVRYITPEWIAKLDSELVEIIKQKNIEYIIIEVEDFDFGGE